jgi:hypothetical protein
MRKTHGKKQTRKNKTKKTRDKGGGGKPKGYPYPWYIRRGITPATKWAAQRGIVFEDSPKTNTDSQQKPKHQSTNPTSSVTHNNKAHKVGNPTVSKSERPFTRSQTRSTAPEPLQQNP